MSDYDTFHCTDFNGSIDVSTAPTDMKVSIDIFLNFVSAIRAGRKSNNRTPQKRSLTRACSCIYCYSLSQSLFKKIFCVFFQIYPINISSYIDTFFEFSIQIRSERFLNQIILLLNKSVHFVCFQWIMQQALCKTLRFKAV